jgi:hypothetical protein
MSRKLSVQIRFGPRSDLIDLTAALIRKEELGKHQGHSMNDTVVLNNPATSTGGPNLQLSPAVVNAICVLIAPLLLAADASIAGP